MMKELVVLSLFDGMSCGQIAFGKARINVTKYFACEIKSHAIKCTQNNFPNTIQIGDVTKVYYYNGILHTENGNFKTHIDIVIGGSPCQNLSLINFSDNRGLDGEKSVLFYEYLRILREVNPLYFLLENVASMKNIDRDIITKEMCVNPIFINSSLVSAQQRRRYYWTNIPNIEQPRDKGVLLRDIIIKGSKREEKMSDKKIAFVNKKKNGTMYVRVDGEKSMPITARGYSAWNTQFITDDCGIRDLLLSEYKALQTIPDWYRFNCIKSKATDLIGDGWTVDVISHIFSYIPISHEC